MRLLETPGLGRETARRLLAAFASPRAILEAPARALRDFASAAVVQALAQPAATFDDRLHAALAWLAGDAQRSVVTLGDARYPSRLLHSADPPLLLYVQGDVSLLSAPSIGVVGSRAPSAQGLDNATNFSHELSNANFVIVSGLALGIDGAAHEGGLKGAAGTIAVVGTGLDRVYPARHRSLAKRIAERGALVSEFAPGTPALPENFPLRNRIIAGLSLGTLVVEAAVRSGSLITARLALESDRDVYAIPGSIHSPQARGCHALIRAGALLVESAQDIIDDQRGRDVAAPKFGAAAPDAPLSADLPPDDLVLQALGADPTTLDALMARTGWGVAELSAYLLELELTDRVARLPGGLFQRRWAS